MAGFELDFVRVAALDIEFPREKDLPDHARGHPARLDGGGQKLDIFRPARGALFLVIPAKAGIQGNQRI
jgi:hypothetical protein